MPNWTANTVTMKGIGKEDLYKFVKDPVTGRKVKYFDFDKLIPEPRTKEELITKYGKQYLNNECKNVQKDEEKPWFDWYNWRATFWGTKWNACNCMCSYSDDEIQFDTAWNEPSPIWEALTRKFPDRLVEISADYEEGYTINSEWLNGEETWEQTYGDIEDEYDDEEEEED
jgi:hypothetical protein